MADLAIKYAGLEFKNPVVAVAGPLGRTFEALRKSIEAGVGAVTLKSANARPKEDMLPKPGCHVYPKPAHMFLRKYGLPTLMFNWEGVPVDFTAEKEAELISKIKPLAQKHNTKIIANIHPDLMYMEDEEMFRKDLEIILDSGPDLLEVCFCPYHLPPEVTYQESPIDTEVKDAVLRSYIIPKDVADIPVIAKSNCKIFSSLFDDINKAGINTCHITEGPLVYGTIVDIEKMKPLVPGLGLITYGTLRRPLVNLGCARVKALGDVELISSSGIWNANDSIERMMCGAHLVGLHTAIQYHGHQLYGKIINGISEFLDRKGLKIDEIIGVAVNDIVSQEAHDEFMRECDITNDEIRPVIDIEKCTQCGLCAHCIHGGISMEDGNPKTHLDLCVRCGVCESLCPVEAIVLERT